MHVDPVHRLRGVLLAGIGAVALVLGGWWWQAQAPGAATSTGPGGDFRLTTTGRVEPEPRTSVMLDARTGSVVPTSPGRGYGSAEAPSSAGHRGVRRAEVRHVVWTESTKLSEGAAVVRQTPVGYGELFQLRLRCVGPGDLLVVVVGARAADPIMIGCDGAVATTEVTGTGGPVRISFSTAGAEPLHLEARLIAPS
ncbi:hypothetical protein ABZ738_00855 [Micromonospora sp. NPDC047793]|uniref:hypothetical protein n=1 Tax=unclassified Micromonospora TaxID=2617518 RepID=UPI0010335825|nr:hypothetical protein [Verrucosispora sp. SN26_14.1]TBL27197.1 hypothetical protein EYA84_29720 [Verrucosispora sp. SN26_14.1]